VNAPPIKYRGERKKGKRKARILGKSQKEKLK